MKSNGSMNRVYRVIWNAATGAWQAVCEIGKSHGKEKSSRSLRRAVAVAGVVMAGGALAAPAANELPTGGNVVAGAATISTSGSRMDVLQSTQRTAIDWQTFNIGSASHVHFQQPSGGAALNRVLDTNASQIYGKLTSTGQVFLVNPNGVFFAPGAQVDVGGIVASTLGISNADFMAGSYTFAGTSSNAIINQGNIKVGAGGTAAFIAAKITNTGSIEAPGGNVLLGAGSKVTLDMGGPVKLQIENDALETLIENGGAIKADGGVVWLTSQAAANLASSVINNTGVIEAQTLATGEKGEIILFAHDGTANISGKLDVSAPLGGDGGFIETSGSQVKIDDASRISMASAMGLNGSWLIDPVDFTIGSTKTGSVTAGSPSGDISGQTLSAALGVGSVTILSSQGSITSGSGNINVNDAVLWTANTTLTLTAAKDININAVVSANGSAMLVMNTATTNGGDAGVSGGKVKVGMDANGFTGRVEFYQGDGTTPRSGTGFLTINGEGFTVLGSNDLGTEGVHTGNNLQGIKGSLAGNFALGSPIDATATSTWNTNTGFRPIGTLQWQAYVSNPFAGKFDGLGHTITGLTIKPTSCGGTMVCANGLFAGVGSTGIVRNIGLTGAQVITGFGYAGSLAGLSYGTVHNAFSSQVNISGTNNVGGLVGGMFGNLADSFSTGAVTGSGYGIGGLVGRFNKLGGSLTNSYSTATVTATGSGLGIGGLAGFLVSGAISNSYATGSVTVSGSSTSTGGLVGSSATGGVRTITNSYATGDVSVTASSTGTGGLVGVNGAGSTVTNSYSSGAVSGGNSVSMGAAIGDNGTAVTSVYYRQDTGGVNDGLPGIKAGPQTGGTTALTSAQMTDKSNFIGFDTTSSPLPVWGNAGGVNNGYPVLCALTTCTLGTPLTYTLSNLTRTYSGTAYSLTNVWSASSIFGNTYSSWVLGTDYNFQRSSSNVTSYTNAGTYSNISVAILKSGYLVASSGNTLGSLTIDPASLSVTANNVSQTFNGSAYAGTPGVAYSGFVGGQNASVLGGTLAYAYNPVSPTNAGSYVITPSGLTSDNYDITFNDGTLTISQPTSSSSGSSTNSLPQDTAVSTVQSTVLQPVANTTTTTNVVSPNAPPPSVVFSQQGSLPVFDVNGGLAFVQVGGQQGEGSGSSTTSVQSMAELPPDLGGRDPLGFMRVFVIGGGLNLPDVVASAPRAPRKK